MGLEPSRIKSFVIALCREQDWRLPGILCGVALVIGLTGTAGIEALRFDRAGIGDGQLWRLVSGHLAHLGWSHLILNLAGVLLVWLLVGEQYRLWQWVAILLVSTAGVSAGLWFIDTELLWYVGLSGVLHGLLVAGVIPGMLAKSGEAYFIAAGVVAKLVYEQFIGPMPGSESSAGGAVVVNAHLYGAIAGVAAAVFTRRSAQRDAAI